MKNQNSNVAVSGILWKNGKFLLLKRCNKPLKWGPLAGRVFKGENPVDGVLREIKEEANIKAKILMPIAFWYGKHNNVQYTSISFLCKHISGQIKLSKEHCDAKWQTIEQIKKEDVTHNIQEFIRGREVMELFKKGKIK